MKYKIANKNREVLQAGFLLLARYRLRLYRAGVVQASNYYPSGVTMAELPRRTDQGVQRYKFGGKELDRSFGLDAYDFEARPYNPVLMRFTGVDPLASKYPAISPFAYCLNNPVNAVDPDGRLVIFINGMHLDGSGGTQAYWGKDGIFATKVQNYLKDYSTPIFRDGSVGGLQNIKNNISAEYRYNMGNYEGNLDAEDIINRITDKNGNFKETIKIITHSMGAAYAKGYVSALVNYFILHDIPLSLLEFEADFALFQPKKQNANIMVPTYQFSHSNDKVAGNDKMWGATQMNTSRDEKQGHGISTFIDQINNLPEGRYKFENGKIVPY